MAKSSRRHQARRKPSESSSGGQTTKEPVKNAFAGTTSAARSRIMRSIGQKNTRPEIQVRKLLHAMGYRFRLHQPELPGRPDIVMRRHGVIVQVHGCFWHQHGCKISNVPSTRKEYWLPKLARNVERDFANDALLSNMGWRVLTVWECELTNLTVVTRKIQAFVKRKRYRRRR